MTEVIITDRKGLWLGGKKRCDAGLKVTFWLKSSASYCTGQTVDLSEFAKAEGGVTCLSLLVDLEGVIGVG